MSIPHPTLSYGGRIKLVNWVFAGLFFYWINGTTLFMSVFTKVRQLAYKFIWAKMTLPKKEGVLGLRIFLASARALHMKRLHYLWTNSDSILPAWIRDSYI